MVEYGVREKIATTATTATTYPPRENIKKNRRTDDQTQPWSSPLREVPSVENFWLEELKL